MKGASLCVRLCMHTRSRTSNAFFLGSKKRKGAMEGKTLECSFQHGINTELSPFNPKEKPEGRGVV